MKTVKNKAFTPLENAISFCWRESRSLRSLSLQPIRKRNSLTGFTLVEVITAVVIIMILLSILLPALNMVRKYAKDTQQKAQLVSIEIGINLYKNEDCFGDYPPAGKPSTRAGTTTYYDASQMLAEAMFGLDLLGVDPNSTYTYSTNDLNNYASSASALHKRKGPYLDRTHVSVFKAKDIFSNTNYLEPEGYLICDAYTAVTKTITMNNGSSRKVKIGTPVLYYKANTGVTDINSTNPGSSIYNSIDNEDLITLGSVAKSTNYHHFDHDSAHYTKLTPSEDGREFFYDYITDPMISGTKYPLRPDSFLLISAGYDGLYGTADDICNFEPTLE